MPREQARRTPPPAPPRPWGWFSGGFFLGGFLVFMLYVGGMLPGGDGVTAPGSPGAETGVPAAKPAPGDHDFDFYTLLPQSEVIAPDVPEYNPGKTREADAVSYIIQAGSFRRHEDADRLRAQLILMGLDASIEKVETNNGETWHRVQAGPYESRRAVNVARQKLADNRIESMVLRRRL